MRIWKLITALVVAVTACVGVSALPASAAVYAKHGVSLAPYCEWGVSASTGVLNSHYLNMSAYYSRCDLMVSDWLYSPNQCVHAFDVENGQSSARYCTGSEQNRVSDSVNGHFRCTPGHRLVVDVSMWAWRGVTVQGSTGSIRVVCGGKSW